MRVIGREGLHDEGEIIRLCLIFVLEDWDADCRHGMRVGQLVGRDALSAKRFGDVMS